MPQTIPSIRPHTAAVIAALTAATGKPVGDGHAPEEGAYADGWGRGVFTPYLVVVCDDVKFGGPIGDPQADATLMYRVLAVGKSREQAEWMSDKGRSAFTRTNLRLQVIPDRKVMGVIWTGRSGVEVDHGVEPPLWYVRDTFTLMTTPGVTP